MHMAPQAAAWVAWAVWTCNTYTRRFTVIKRAGFGPLFFCALKAGAHSLLRGAPPRWKEPILGGQHFPVKATD
jgi:hypothetical protein